MKDSSSNRDVRAASSAGFWQQPFVALPVIGLTIIAAALLFLNSIGHPGGASPLFQVKSTILVRERSMLRRKLRARLHADSRTCIVLPCLAGLPPKQCSYPCKHCMHAYFLEPLPLSGTGKKVYTGACSSSSMGLGPCTHAELDYAPMHAMHCSLAIPELVAVKSSRL